MNVSTRFWCMSARIYSLSHADVTWIVMVSLEFSWPVHFFDIAMELTVNYKETADM